MIRKMSDEGMKLEACQLLAENISAWCEAKSGSSGVIFWTKLDVGEMLRLRLGDGISCAEMGESKDLLRYLSRPLFIIRILVIFPVFLKVECWLVFFNKTYQLFIQHPPRAQDIVPFPAIASMRPVNAPRGRTGSCRPRSRRRRWFGGRLELGWTVLASAIPQEVGYSHLPWEYHLPISTWQAKGWNIIGNNC